MQHVVNVLGEHRGWCTTHDAAQSPAQQGFYHVTGQYAPLTLTELSHDNVLNCSLSAVKCDCITYMYMYMY